MREILFRAKDEASHKWVYGYYVHLPSAAGSVHFMHVPAGNPDEHNDAFYIDPETVGQFTGLTDKNGKKIFEGDILKYYDTMHEVVFCTINGSAFFGIVMRDRGEIWAFNYMTTACDAEIIGNIHDSPELLEGKE